MSDEAALKAKSPMGSLFRLLATACLALLALTIISVGSWYAVDSFIDRFEGECLAQCALRHITTSVLIPLPELARYLGSLACSKHVA